MTEDDQDRAGLTFNAHVRVEIRDLPRLQLLVWELRQLENRLRVGARPEGEELERILDRFMADITADEPAEE